MPQCSHVATQIKGEWEFFAPYPISVISSPTGGNISVSSVACIFKRPVTCWFSCCNHGVIPIDGTQWGISDKVPDSSLPVISIGFPLPLKGALGAVADVLGISINILTWFTDEEAAKERCIGAIPTRTVFEVTIPTCDSQDIIINWPDVILENGTTYSIPPVILPAEEAIEMPPDDAEPVASNLKPSISIQPNSQSIASGGTAIFTIAAQGDKAAGPIGYTWLMRRINDTYASQIAGNSSSIEFPASMVDDQARLWVLVSNNFGSVLSQAVILTVIDPSPASPPPVAIGIINSNSIRNIEGEYEGEFGFRTIASQTPSLSDIPTDSNKAPNASPLILLENDQLFGPAHSLHSDIESIGQGRYSHWNGGGGAELRFSTSDNSDPRTNGRTYKVAVPTGTQLAIIPNDFMTKVEGEYDGSLGYRVDAANLDILARLRSDSSSAPNASPLVLLENGNPVGQAHSQHADIQRIGQGKYSHWSDGRTNIYLWFSTPDNSDPRTNSRTYAIAV